MPTAGTLSLGGAWDTKPGHNQEQGKATVPLLSPHRPCDKNQFLGTCGAWDTSRRDHSPRDPLCRGHPLSTRLHAALRTPLHARLHTRLRARLLHAQVDFCLQQGLSQPKKAKQSKAGPRCGLAACPISSHPDPTVLPGASPFPPSPPLHKWPNPSIPYRRVSLSIKTKRSKRFARRGSDLGAVRKK